MYYVQGDIQCITFALGYMKQKPHYCVIQIMSNNLKCDYEDTIYLD